MRLDMSAYAGHQAHEQLVGFNAAYSNASAGVLTGFIKSHPNGVVLADEIEKAHRNTQNIFLQILDYGKIYENNTKESIDCSRLTVVFTTNLGRELYNTPEKFGLLQNSQRIEDVILDALGKDVARQSDGEDSAGLTPEMLSRLAKGHLVLFERLDGLALERIAQKTVEQVSAEMQNSAGIHLDVGDPIILTLMVLRFGANGDARRLTTSLRNYLYSCIKDLLFENKEMLLGESNKILLLKVNGLRIVMPDLVNLPDPVKKAMEDRSRILVIDEDQWAAEPVDNLEWHRVGNLTAADDLLREGKVDYILLDLNIGMSANDPGMDKGLEILRWLRTHYPEVPLYVFSESPERRKLSPETLQNVAREGGARGVLQKLFYGNGEQDATNRNAFFRQLKEIDAMLRRERLLNYYRRRFKTLEFDLALQQEKLTDDGYLKLELTRVREIMTVAAKDRTQIGWVDIPTERFDDIAGAKHAKDRLMEISKWLANPVALRDLGLELPKGILLTGPPGTGKTSLARALAGESQVPFFAISGSEVLKKWVGDSEATIRDLFTRARNYAPSIIFIDEIDGIAGKRSADGGNDVRNSVLNQLLSQMDGFSQERGRPVFVMAATNRPDILDPAALRPGRFDLQIEVPPPSPEARGEIFELYMKKVPKDDDVRFDDLAARSAGMSGAEIRQVCKEAAWLAYREGLRKVHQKHLNEAITSVRFGLSSEVVLMDDEAKRTTAVHEAGHAVAQIRLFAGEPVSQISILPRGRALGFTENQSAPRYTDLSADRIAKKAQVFLAGRIAEELVLGSDCITAGCANDLERASALAAQSISRWGMNSKIGLVSFAGLCSGLNLNTSTGESSSINEVVLEEVKAWISAQAEAVRVLLSENRASIDRLVQALMEKETLYGEDIQRLVG